MPLVFRATDLERPFVTHNAELLAMLGPQLPARIRGCELLLSRLSSMGRHFSRPVAKVAGSKTQLSQLPFDLFELFSGLRVSRDYRILMLA